MTIREQSIDIAEAQSEALGRIERVIHDIGWALDSEVSGLRKDDAGYRKGNKANRDGGDNGSLLDLLAASFKARELLRALGPAADLIARWERESAEAKAA